ncbi:hypothetical protein ABZ502_34210 [Streptomyces abikoensis]|uniref:hypothetical protein n=1 Tax=Streptomyces abikoensis TaxID=97398 RepID=UPI0033E59A56
MAGIPEPNERAAHDAELVTAYWDAMVDEAREPYDPREDRYLDDFYDYDIMRPTCDPR